jgi:hypothetical protein
LSSALDVILFLLFHALGNAPFLLITHKKPSEKRFRFPEGFLWVGEASFSDAGLVAEKYFFGIRGGGIVFCWVLCCL